MRSLTMIRDERGVGAVVVSVSLVAIMAATMLAVDAGMMWSRRRLIATATDAAALEQARLAALSVPRPASCASSWTDLVMRNAGSSAEPISCDVEPGAAPGAGSIEVQARVVSPVRFGGLLNVGDQKPFASSIAQYGPLQTVFSGLRPMGLCTENEHVAEWLSYLNGNNPGYPSLRGSGSEHPVYAGAGVVHRIGYSKTQPDACGGAPGNWGFVDFNGGHNANTELVDWIRNGYEENAVAVGDCNADNQTSGEPCMGDPGSRGGSIGSALDDIIGSPTGLPLFDLSTRQGHLVEYQISGFVGVILHGYRITGADSGRYLDLEFTSLLLSGRCCGGPAGVDGGVRGVRLCSFDHDPVSEPTRCG